MIIIHKRYGGFTLVELIALIAMIGIIVAVAVSIFAGIINKAEESACDFNLKTVEKIYSTFLAENDVVHKDSVFKQFLIE